MKEEIWKPVNGFELRFKISNHGRLLSIGGKYGGECVLPCAIDMQGYVCCTLRMKPKKLKTRIHVLVAQHFISPRPSDVHCVNHLDGNKLNNYFENLEWTTNAGNIKHAIDIGLFDTKGEKHFNSKLKKDDVLKMRKLYFEDKKTQKEIGVMFGVCRRQAGDVINGVNWGWLK